MRRLTWSWYVGSSVTILEAILHLCLSISRRKLTQAFSHGWRLREKRPWSNRLLSRGSWGNPERKAKSPGLALCPSNYISVQINGCHRPWRESNEILEEKRREEEKWREIEAYWLPHDSYLEAWSTTWNAWSMENWLPSVSHITNIFLYADIWLSTAARSSLLTHINVKLTLFHLPADEILFSLPSWYFSWNKLSEADMKEALSANPRPFCLSSCSVKLYFYWNEMFHLRREEEVKKEEKRLRSEGA